MFLLRRKLDNKYFVNRSQSSVVYNRTTGIYERRPESDFWTDDVMKCVPFKTKSAAMQSRGIQGLPIDSSQCPIPVAAWGSTTPMERDLTYRARNAWFKEREKERSTALHEKYECVEVEIRIKNETTGNGIADSVSP